LKITVLGGGSWGTTVASLAAGRHPTVLWARDPDVAREVDERHTNEGYLPGCTLPDVLRSTADLAEAVGHAEVLVVGVPSKGFRAVLEAARPHIHPWIPVVSLAKGFETETLLRPTEIIGEVLPGHPAAALTGPNIAREIVAGQAAASVIATEDLAVASALQRILRRGVFRLYVNHDVIGCELGGALKNVIAIAAGIAQGLDVGDNTRAAVVTRGLAEITRLGTAMGGEPETFAGLTGLGDLMVTCMSPHSRNRRVGEELGKGRPLDEILADLHMVAEGVNTAATAMTLAERYDVHLPICEEIHKVVSGQISGTEAYRGLHPPGHEREPG
jgi:glycerol-3-phosphate dehydrogenase (NAD(P)+)